MTIFKQLGIGILSFRRSERLERLVNSIEKHTRRPYRLYIYDNYSDQKTIRVLKKLENAGRATVIYGGNNAGPFHGFNQILDTFYARREDIPYFAKIDDDCCITTPNWDDIMLRPFFHHAEKERVMLVTCKHGNPANFPLAADNSIVQCAAEFFMFRTAGVGVVGRFIEHSVDGHEFHYSMDSDWTEKIGLCGYKIIQVEDVYEAPRCATMQRPEYFPGEKAALKGRVAGSVERRGAMQGGRKRYLERLIKR